MPWSIEVHEGILEAALGPRPPAGTRRQGACKSSRPSCARRWRRQVASLDSQPKLLRSLHRAGVLARSTSRWELAEFDHPVIAPLLAYKKPGAVAERERLVWLDEWAGGGRFRPCVRRAGPSPGGGRRRVGSVFRNCRVSCGPRCVPTRGWTLVVADVALEPRVLAAMPGDLALAEAARARMDDEDCRRTPCSGRCTARQGESG
ncbi:MAG: hypothetical protein R2692_08295 [Microbacterium sp.]